MLSESHRIPVIYIPLLGFARFVKDLTGIFYKKIYGRFAELKKGVGITRSLLLAGFYCNSHGLS